VQIRRCRMEVEPKAAPGVYSKNPPNRSRERVFTWKINNPFQRIGDEISCFLEGVLSRQRHYCRLQVRSYHRYPRSSSTRSPKFSATAQCIAHSTEIRTSGDQATSQKVSQTHTNAYQHISKMIYHLVLFKLKKDNSEEVLENFFVGLKSLVVLNGVLSLKVNTINNEFSPSLYPTLSLSLSLHLSPYLSLPLSPSLFLPLLLLLLLLLL
jgi:hypothetical protein